MINKRIFIFLLIFLSLVALVISALWQRHSLKTVSEEYNQVSIFELLLNPNQFLGSDIEIVGYLAKNADTPLFLFTDEKRMEMFDYSSTIPFATDDKEFYKYIIKNCLGKWVRIQGKYMRSSRADYYITLNGIFDVKRADISHCQYNYK